MRINFDGLIYSWQRGGGIRRYYNELLLGLVNKGVEVNLFLPEPHYSFVKDNRIKTTHGFPICLPAVSMKSLRRIMNIYNIIKASSFFRMRGDIFHSTYYSYYNDIKVPQVLTVHDMTYEKFPHLFKSLGSRRFIERKRRSIEMADSIICVSNATKNNLLNFYKIPEQKINVIYHGVDTLFNSAKNQQAEIEFKLKKSVPTHFVLFVGNRNSYKNFTFFIECFSKWSKKGDFYIVLVGGGDLNKNEQKIIKTLNLENKIKWLGNVSDQELKYLYNLAHALVIPSLDEGFGLPLVEALLCGTRVLCSNIEVFKELAGSLPIYFDPKDKDSLIDALEKSLTILVDSRAIEKIKNVFQWSNCVSSTEKVYKQLI